MKTLKIIGTAALSLALAGCGNETPPLKTPEWCNSQGQCEMIYLYHTEEDPTYGMDWWEWGSGSKYASSNGVVTITPGAVNSALVFNPNSGGTIDASLVNTFKFTVKGSTVGAIRVPVKTDIDSESVEIATDISEGTSLGNGWVEMIVPIPSYANLKNVGFIIPGAGEVQVKDIYLAKDDNIDDSTPEPTDGTFVLISDVDNESDIEFDQNGQDTTISTMGTCTDISLNIQHNGQNAWSITKEPTDENGDDVIDGNDPSNWGAALGFMDGINQDLSKYEYLDIAIAADSVFKSYTIGLSSDGVESEIVLPIDKSSPEWQSVRLDLDKLGLNNKSIDYVSVFADADYDVGGTFYVSDYKFVKLGEREYDSNTEDEFVFKHSELDSNLIEDNDDFDNTGNITFSDLGTGTVLGDVTYLSKEAWSLTAANAGDAVLALQGDISDGSTIDPYKVDLSQYTHLALDVSSSGSFSKYAVSIKARGTGNAEIEHEVEFSLAKANEWNTIVINLDQYGVNLSNVIQVKVSGVTNQDGDNILYVTDFYAYDTGYHPTKGKDYDDAFVFIDANQQSAWDGSDVIIDNADHLNDGNATISNWGSGTKFDTNASYLNKGAVSLTKNGWGTVLAFSGDIYGEIQTFDFDTDVYNKLQISLATDNSAFNSARVRFVTKQGDLEHNVTLSGLDTNWQDFTIKLNELPIKAKDIYKIAVMGDGGSNGDVLYVTDLKVSK